MVIAKKLKRNLPRHNGLPAGLSITLAGMLLTLPALAHAASDGEPFHGFADVGYAAHSKESNDPKGFNTGSFDLYLTPQFDSHVKGLVELIFETTREGTVSPDLERVQMGYIFNDNATLWAGRFHTPFGYWNTGFHHGAQIQTSVSRPRFLDFEDKGGILPAHMVGLWGSGKVRLGNDKLTYDVYAGNGPKIVMGTDSTSLTTQTPGVLSINAAGDDNHQAMVGLNLGYEFSGMLDGLRVAVHALRGDVGDDNKTAALGTLRNKTELGMAGGSIVYQDADWEVLSEYYSFNNTDQSGTSGSHSSWADYLQVGRTFNGLTPYLRAEKTVLSQQDNYFSMQESGQSYTRAALGIKYDLNPKAALKFEMLSSDFAAEGSRSAYSYRSLLAQYAIHF